ncbi:MAG: AI-2E family transporter [Planctomycetia bacterium]
MARLMSLGILLGLVAVFGLLSLRVMAIFLLPLLLAAMLVVIFGPLHRWMLRKLQCPDWVAAGLTTLVVLSIVLVPLLLLVVRAGTEAMTMLKAPNGLRLDPAVLEGMVTRLNESTGLSLTADAVNAELTSLAEDWIGPLAAGASKAFIKVVIGLVVLIVSFFYFLADGPRMFNAVMRLVPLDRRYQWQLLEEFEEVSRAVVSSTLLAAIAQATLAGIGFAVVGLKGVFLLTLLTFFGALVPFVGAAAVWGTASLYLLFFVKNTWAALGLAMWGACVVSTIDNIIKPIVLHGQSKLHPLLALLSVLGGVAALGPIGIFVGPIAVAFLQAALTMLQIELDTISASDRRSGGEQAPGTAPGSGAGVARPGVGSVKS